MSIRSTQLHSPSGEMQPPAPSWRKAPAFGRLTPRRRPSMGVAELSSGELTNRVSYRIADIRFSVAGRSVWLI